MRSRISRQRFALHAGEAVIRRRLLFAAVVLFVSSLVIAVGATRRAAADDATPATGKGKQWALLIGIEKYHRASHLRYTINDVRQIAKTLHERGGVPKDRILQITDDASNPRFQPLRNSLMAELPDWLAKCAPEDRILVYFSGHGFRDSEGKMYLAPIDCDPGNPEPTGIAIEWFREQISRCRAGFKLLVIDACHAGSEKGEDDTKGIAAKDLGEPFRDLGGVITLASSTGDEKSQIWEEKKQSLFSYWLNEGLRGHADVDGDNRIDVDELNKYVHRNVTRTAQDHFPHQQTPVRIVRSGTPGVPVVLELKPLSLKQVLADIADQLAWAMQDQKLQRIAVLEFTNDTKVGELLGANFGLVGRYCSEQIAHHLTELGGDRFTVVSRRRLQSALRDQQFNVNDLGSASALERLSDTVGGLPVLALGTLRNRAGRVINLKCELMHTDSGNVAASAAGVAWLNESEWAMLGQSAATNLALLPPGGTSTHSKDEQITQVVSQLDDAAQGPHPLADPNFPYRVRLKVNGEERKGVLRGNDWFIPLRKGEVYEINVENLSGRPVLMRLLVDGLNTLPEKQQTKGITTMLVAPRVNLDKARHWILDPSVAKLFAIRGFVTETGAGGRLREFLVTDADQSLAARQKFTDQVGLITAAFYLPKGSTRGGLGTGLGTERAEDIQERGGTQVGDLLAVVNIRYVDAEALLLAAD